MANPSIVQSWKDASQPTASGILSLGDAYTSNVASGNLLIVAVTWVGTATISSVTDSLTQTWTLGVYKTETVGNTSGAIYFFKSTAAGADTVTVHWNTPGVGFPEMTIAEFAPGTFSWGSTDGSTSASGSSTAPASGSITTTNAVDVVIGMASGANAITAGTGGYTFHQTTQDQFGVEYMIQTTAGSQNATFTESPTGVWIAMIWALAATSAGGPTRLGTATLGSKNGITSRLSQILAPAALTLGAKSGLSQAKFAQLLAAVQLGAKAGVSVAKLSQDFAAILGAKAGISQATVLQFLRATLGARDGITAASLTGGSAPTGKLYTFTDGSGTHRIGLF